MKGYVFTVNKGVPIGKILNRGYFGVRLTKHPTALYATLADFCTFKPKQKVFFFQERWLYGIAEFASPAPLHLNFPGSDAHGLAEVTYSRSEEALTSDSGNEEWQQIPYVFAFKSSPYLFERGVDMDEALSTPNFDAWGLRFMSGKSFFELNDSDTDTLTKIFMQRFANSGKTLPEEARPDPFTAKLSALFQESHTGSFNLTNTVVRLNRFVMPRAGRVENENILHGMFVEALQSNESFLPLSRKGLIRTAAYHELPASPPKPAEYADSIDVFCTLATRENPGVPLHFEVIELKSDILPWSGETAATHLSQVMKYVDFVARNYAGGNYSAVTAYLIASQFSDDFKILKSELARRTYVLDPHDEGAATRTWDSLHLMRYRWDAPNRRLRLEQL